MKIPKKKILLFYKSIDVFIIHLLKLIDLISGKFSFLNFNTSNKDFIIIYQYVIKKFETFNVILK